MDDTTVGFAIAAGDKGRAIGQLGPTNLAVEDKPMRGRPHHRHSQPRHFGGWRTSSRDRRKAERRPEAPSAYGRCPRTKGCRTGLRGRAQAPGRRRLGDWRSRHQAGRLSTMPWRACPTQCRAGELRGAVRAPKRVRSEVASRRREFFGGSLWRAPNGGEWSGADAFGFALPRLPTAGQSTLRPVRQVDAGCPGVLPQDRGRRCRGEYGGRRFPVRRGPRLVRTGFVTE